MTSSTVSTAKALCTNNKNAAARTKNTVAVALWAALVRTAQPLTRPSHSEAATEDAASQLFITKRYHRIDLHGAAGGNVAGERRGHDEQADNTGVGDDVCGADSVEHRTEQAGETE